MCDFCHKHAPDLRRCSRCKTVQYCSVAHQRAHWKTQHKQECNETIILRRGIPVALEAKFPIAKAALRAFDIVKTMATSKLPAGRQWPQPTTCTTWLDWQRAFRTRQQFLLDLATTFGTRYPGIAAGLNACLNNIDFESVSMLGCNCRWGVTFGRHQLMFFT